MHFIYQKRSKTEESNNQPVPNDSHLPEDANQESDPCSSPVLGEFDPEEFEILDEVGEEDESFEEFEHCNQVTNQKFCAGQIEPDDEIKKAHNNETNGNCKNLFAEIKESPATCESETKNELKSTRMDLDNSIYTKIKDSPEPKTALDLPIGKIISNILLH